MCRKILSTSSSLCHAGLLSWGMMYASLAMANPQIEAVTKGNAHITESGKKLNIHQQSDKAVIDWRSFDIEVDEHTQFYQPNAHSMTLNRVNSNDPSRILGKLTANGNLVLVNPNGVFFGSNATVDVNSIIATTSDIDNADFMNGKLIFDKPGNPNAAIINQGTITAKEAGLVGLVAPNVINHGVITAKLGRVELASGDGFFIDLYGDGLYQLKVSDAVAAQLIQNTGTLDAAGGTIAITAAAAGEIVNSLVHIEGELHAPTIEQQGGVIRIMAEGSNAVEGNQANLKGKKQGNSNVTIQNATLNASGTENGEQGGQIEILGDRVIIGHNTLMDASGYEAVMSHQHSYGGTASLTSNQSIRQEEDFLAHENRAGGSIKIGGDYLGGGETPAASYVYVDPFSLILNDAIHSGDGGRTIIWSDDTTQYYGNVYARGGIHGGNGGFLETSGKNTLVMQGMADLTPSTIPFNKGTWLLDPTTITIIGNETSVYNNAGQVAHLDFDEGSGVNAADSTGNNNDGTLTGGAQWSANSAPTPQSNSFSVDVDNGADYVDISDDASLQVTDVTLSSWIYIVDSGGTQVIFGKQVGGGSGNSYAVWHVGGKLRASIEGFNPILLDATVLANDTWHHVAYTFNDATNTQSLYLNGSVLQTGTTNSSISYSASPISVGKDFESPNRGSDCCDFHGLIDDFRVYDNEISANNVAELYGNRLTVAGLETMSNTADIVLQADNTINLDLQGDTLNLADDRSITIQTTNGNISTASAGTIITNRTAAGGNITFNAGGAGNINIDHALTLTAQNGGVVTFTAGGGNVNVSADLAITTDNLVVTGNFSGADSNSFTFEQATATNSIGIGTGGSPDISLSDALITDIKSSFGSYSFGSLSNSGDVINYTANWEDPLTILTAGDFTNEAVISSDDTILIRAGGDIILNQDIATTSATANALVLSAIDDFTNNAGSDALSATNSRWLVYSDEPAGNTRDDLFPDAVEFNKTYTSDAPGTIGANNRFVYATATQPTITYQVGDDTANEGTAYSDTPAITPTGLVGDDTINNIGQTGSATISTNYTGTGNGAFTLSGAIGSLANTLGYQYAFIDGTLTVAAAPAPPSGGGSSGSSGSRPVVEEDSVEVEIEETTPDIPVTPPVEPETPVVEEEDSISQITLPTSVEKVINGSDQDLREKTDSSSPRNRSSQDLLAIQSNPQISPLKQNGNKGYATGIDHVFYLENLENESPYTYEATLIKNNNTPSNPTIQIRRYKKEDEEE